MEVGGEANIEDEQLNDSIEDEADIERESDTDRELDSAEDAQSGRMEFIVMLMKSYEL